MTDKTREQIEKARLQTFGVEVHGNNITRRKAAATAAEYFGTERYENTDSYYEICKEGYKRFVFPLMILERAYEESIV